MMQFNVVVSVGGSIMTVCYRAYRILASDRLEARRLARERASRKEPSDDVCWAK